MCCNTTPHAATPRREDRAIRTALSLLPPPGAGLALDPRWKLAAFAAATLAAAVVRTLPAALLALAGALALAAAARLPWAWLLRRLGAVLPFLALLALPLPFLLRGPGPAWEWGPLHASAHGAAAGLRLLAQGTAAAVLVLTLLATAPLDALLKAAHALRVPGLLVHLTLLSYRYAFVLADELARLRVALRVRGYRNRATRHGYRTVGQVAGTLLVRGHERAERVHQAMRCRGFDSRFRSLAAFRTTAADVAAFLLIAGGALGVAAVDWLQP
jgi:cobalt/nickel transport system permease protein